jgi:serine/threonine protein kinase
MSTEPKSVKDIFLAAVEKAAGAERAAFLDEACAGDASMRHRVEALLKAHDEPENILDRPAAEIAPREGLATTEDEPGTEPLGTIIGPYKLLQQLGEGGMGTVYLAQQTEPVKRLVALKIIKAGMDSAEVLARFEQERQALAMMDHPNIAKVLDAGSTEVDGSPSVGLGRPYFVMELVKGIPITKYCDQEHLSPKERLELFIPVCQAVQHAHQKGIIHRDLKPSNVIIALYDGRPVPKVIDFGVAKATGPKLTEHTMFTEVGRILGTLEYMAPEQAEINNLDIDTRADIYSLGVMLYELLTGSPPFTKQQLRGAAFTEMLRIIREVEPPKPSTKLSSSNDLPSIAAKRKLEPKRLCKLVHGDLDWMVMKALEKDRGRRYETANGFAMDIQRYLADEPVLAGPPSASYRARKFLYRNRGPVIAAAAIFLLLVCGIVGTSWSLMRAMSAERAALAARDAADKARKAEAQERAEADEQRNRAEKSEQSTKEEAAKAKRSADEAKAVLEFFQNQVLSAARPEGQEGGLGKDVSIRKAMDAAEPKIAEAFKDQPLVEASIRNVLGSTYWYLREPALAIQQFEQVRAKRQLHLGPDHADTLESINNLALAYQAAGKLDLALPLLEQLLPAAKTKLGPDESLTLTAMNSLASVYQATGKLDLAVPLFEQSLAGLKSKYGADHPNTLNSMNNLANAYRYAGKLDRALPLLEETLAVRKAKLGRDHLDTLISMNSLAGAYKAAGKLDLALELYEQTLAARKIKLGPDNPDTLAAMNNLGLAYLAAGKVDLALPVFEQSLPLLKAKLGPDHPTTLTSVHNLAGAYKAAGKLDLALTLYEQALAARKAKLGPDHPDVLRSMNNLASTYRDAHKLDLALPLFEQALAGMKVKLGPDHPDTLQSMYNLATAYRASGKLELALPLFEQTLAQQKVKLGPDHNLTLATMNNLAAAYWSTRRLDRSIPLFEETLLLSVKKSGKDHPETLNVMANLGVNYRDAGRVKEAIPLLAEALERAGNLKVFPTNLAWVPGVLAETYERTGMFDKAEPIYWQLLDAAKKQSGADDPRTAGPLAQLGSNLLEQKKYAEAEPLLLQGYEGMKERVAKTPVADASGSPPPVRITPGADKTGGFTPPARLVEALERLVQLYEAADKKEEAAKWRALLEEAKAKTAK